MLPALCGLMAGGAAGLGVLKVCLQHRLCAGPTTAAAAAGPGAAVHQCCLPGCMQQTASLCWLHRSWLLLLLLGQPAQCGHCDGCSRRVAGTADTVAGQEEAKYGKIEAVGWQGCSTDPVQMLLLSLVLDQQQQVRASQNPLQDTPGRPTVALGNKNLWQS